MSKTVRVFALVAVLLVGLFAVAMVPTAHAEQPPQQVVLSSAPASTVVQPSASPDAPVPLVVDDGTAERAIGAGASIFWFNRFTPAPTSFPFTLTQVQVLFIPTATGSCAIGDAMDIYVYTDADGNPANGATHVGSITGQTVQSLDDWSTYPANITITSGPDVLIGVVNRGCNAQGQFPAAQDTDSSAMRSWVALGGGATANPPSWPPPTPSLIDNVNNLAGNWMIRGLGETPPTAVEIGQISGSSGNSGWLFGLAGLALVGAGLLAARRR